MRMQWSNRSMPLSCISEVIPYNGLSFNSLLVFTSLENSVCIRCQMLSFPGSFKEHRVWLPWIPTDTAKQQQQLRASIQEWIHVGVLNSRIKLIILRITAPQCEELITPRQQCQQISCWKQAPPKLIWVKYRKVTTSLLGSIWEKNI